MCQIKSILRRHANTIRLRTEYKLSIISKLKCRFIMPTRKVVGDEKVNASPPPSGGMKLHPALGSSSQHISPHCGVTGQEIRTRPSPASLNEVNSQHCADADLICNASTSPYVAF